MGDALIRRENGRTDMTKLISVFRDYENASKNNIVGLDLTRIRKRRSVTFVGNTYMKGLASRSEFVRGNVWISSWRQNPALISTETFEKEKTTPEASADDTIQSIQSFQVITMASALRRYYRR